MKTAAIILAAGKGTRMRSELPKVLHRVAGHPMIRYPLDTLAPLDLNHTVLVVGHGSDQVERYVGSRGTKVQFAHQFEQRGTGHATRIGLEALGPFEGTVLVLPGDTPLIRTDTLRELLDVHESAGAHVTVMTTRVGNPTGYGRILRDDKKKVVGIVEHRDATVAQRAINEVNTSVYAFDRAFLSEAIQNLDSNNAQDEFYLTDVVEAAATEGPFAAAVEGRFEELAGINDRADLAAAEGRLFRRVATAHMQAGVTIHNPHAARIDPDATLAPDVELGVGTQIIGACKISRGTRVDTGSVVTDTNVGENTHIKPYCVITDAEIGSDARIGPFAHLRPGASLDDEVHVGNYVEVKKSRLHKGAKANHLSYIGDSEIGARANVGAGTITCNYDGKNKHRTVIGEGAFIGSNTALVAPVRIGDGATIGAGSTITHDVPADALGVARARQKNIDGYKKK